MIVTSVQLLEKYKNYADPNGKISRDIRDGKIFPVIKGLYETDANAEGINLTQFIYAPSYVSFDTALILHGLIPETFYRTYTCATYNKNKSKLYVNRYGTFIYRDVPDEVFSYGVSIVDGGDYSYQIASVEKALCDKLYTVQPVYSLKAFKNLLFDDLRINEDELLRLDKQFIFQIAPLYKKRNLDWLVKFLKES